MRAPRRVRAACESECRGEAGSRLPAISHSNTRGSRLARATPIASTRTSAAPGRGMETDTMETDRKQSSSGNQREALKQSEKKANEKQPGSFKDKETAEKVVEIPPSGPDKKPIR